MKDIEFIKRFSKISIRGACDKHGVKENNLWADKAADEKIEKVKNELIISVLMLVLEDLNNDN